MSDLIQTGPYERPQSSPPGLPERIGRYRIERVLGKGGYGLVHLAHDDQLHRPVAIKVPHPHLVTAASDAEAYLAEARTVANLDHPNIVPVHDVGSTPEFPCFIVSKFIDGTDLKRRINSSRLSLQEGAELVATVAETLHFAHKQGLVHRDVKPGNILLDRSGKPYVADFGLALREQDVGKGPRYAGTPAYMSPEQARGEGHRVDGRSDLFSLGVVLYELLTGRRPFRADSQEELLEQITGMEARPPRQWNDAIPKELERICLKALSKRATERYSTARDLADDLRHFLGAASAEERSTIPGGERKDAEPATPLPGPLPTPSDPQAVKIVPKGLRSFDATDADFFLELLPGPRDRDGLPDSIRFWKTRIETTQTESTFAVGLIYGPSGCGKSSLVKAGLLPRLAKQVTAVYVEATAEETEARLLKGLRRQVLDLPAHLGLVESLAALRQGRFLAAGKKVVLVLDQFEQWLHARLSEENTELVQALRQCDGGQLQAIVMVRDDFWMAATRFMANLEISLLQGQNCAAVDLFDLLHARKVLAAFGRAYGRLPDNPGQCSRDQDAFLDQAVAGLAQDGKVISVRLALVAEMVKGKTWTPAALKEVGGIAGVGVTFLEETFTASTAPPQHRLHQKAAQAVLKVLLPQSGTDIKGHMRSRKELLAASGFANRPRDFADLLRILDGELRLITPTDPEGVGQAFQPDNPSPAGKPDLPAEKFYQLTHDYLVPSLRDWLTRKQKETRRGRAELRLAERAALWQARRENRHLPAWWEWLTIRLLTRPKVWTEPQRHLMRQATRYHTLRGLFLAVVLTVAVVTGLAIREGVVEQNRQTKAEGLVRSLLNADLPQVPDLIEQIQPYRLWADGRLRQELTEAPDGSPRKLRAALALLPGDDQQANYLFDRLLDARPAEVPILVQALRSHLPGRRERLWEVARQPERGYEGRRLRAVCALADCDPDSPQWDQIGTALVGQLVTENSLHLGVWIEGCRPTKGKLRRPLEEVFHDRSEGRSTERTVAASLLAEYADRAEDLAGLLLDADARQFAALYPKFAGFGADALPPLTAELDRKPMHRWDDQPLDPAWGVPDAELVRQVEGALGLVDERFVLCQTMPLEEFVPLAERLKGCGYRLIRCRPYATAPGVLVAAVWTRDGRAWQLTPGLSAAEAGEEKAKRGQEGWEPVDVAGYLDGGQERYAVVWAKGEGPGAGDWYVGVPDGQHRAAGWGPLREARLNPMTLQTFVGAGGELRFSSVWRASPTTTSYWRDDQQAHAGRGQSAGLQRDVSLTPNRSVQHELLAWLTGSPWSGLALRWQSSRGPHPERHHAGVFQADGALESIAVLGLTPAGQRQHWRELVRQGYRPAALAVVDIPGHGGLAAASVWHRPLVPDDAREKLAQRQANAAVALLRLGRSEKVWPLLEHSPDPRVRSYLLHRLSPLGADPKAIIGRLDDEPEVSVRRALLLSLGEFDTSRLLAADRTALLPWLLRLYREDPDPGLHGAAEWLLRQWGQDQRLREIDQELARAPGQAGGRWYVNGQGQTMVVIPGSVEFLMGSPPAEEGRRTDESRHKRRIGRTFAIAARSVTKEQFLKFLPKFSHSEMRRYPDPSCPIGGVVWYEAAAYCNWLSKQEEIPEDQWCYETNARGQVVKLKANYLSLTGYRLPTEAEWEYACRAGAVTSRYYGETEELLGQYAWYFRNSGDRTWPVGSKKPNDLGLFDMHGNVYSWCQESYKDYPRVKEGIVEDKEDELGVLASSSRVLRGGSFVLHSWILRSAYRYWIAPSNRVNNVGFRPARTYR